MISKKVSRSIEIETLLEIMDKREEYKENSENGLVILLNGKWGSGKTQFLKDLEAQIINNNQYKLLKKYNAWENDIFDDSVIPLFSNINNKTSFNKNVSKLIDVTSSVSSKKIDSIIIKLLKSFIKTKTGFDIDDNLGEFLSDIEKEMKKTDNYLKSYNEFDNIKKKIRKDLIKICNEPSVFIIDELDRCNPSFAISTLETIKHFFDIENCIFIVAVDKEQLGESVKTVFGQNMNADLYFSKFFDYQFDLSAIKITDTVEFPNIINSDFSSEELKSYVESVFKKLNISIRDGKKILNSLSDRLNKHNNWTFLQTKVILFLFVLKYTDLLCYKMLINNKIKDYIAGQLDLKKTNYMNYDQLISMNNHEIRGFVDIINRPDHNVFSGKYVKEFAKEFQGSSASTMAEIHKDNFDYISTQRLYKYIPMLKENLTFEETISQILN